MLLYPNLEGSALTPPTHSSNSSVHVCTYSLARVCLCKPHRHKYDGRLIPDTSQLYTLLLESLTYHLSPDLGTRGFTGKVTGPYDLRSCLTVLSRDSCSRGGPDEVPRDLGVGPLLCCRIFFILRSEMSFSSPRCVVDLGCHDPVALLSSPSVTRGSSHLESVRRRKS